MFKIDIHTHIMPENMPKWADQFGYDGFIHLDHQCGPGCANMMVGDRFFRKIDQNCWSPEARIEDCEHHNVNVQVLSTIPVLFNYWAKPEHTLQTSQYLNDHIAETVAKYPHRFVGLGTLPMQAPQLAAKELELFVKELNLAGIEIGTHINNKNLDDEDFFPIYETAEKLGAAIFVHPWDMMGKEHMPKYWLPWLVSMPAETSRAICSMIFGNVFEKFPKLRVAFAHGGGSFPATIGRIEHGFNVRPDLCAINNKHNPRKYLGQFYLDSLVHDERMLHYIIELIGADKIALGTDYPFPLGELEPGKLIEETGLDNAVKERLLNGTALEWLGLEKERFLL